MSKTISISSQSQLDDLIATSKIVVADFWAEWCGPCKAVAPIFEQLSAQLSKPNHITFVKIDTDAQKDIAGKYSIRSLPTFMIFKNTAIVETIQGADPRKLSQVVKKLSVESGEGDDKSGGFAEASGSGSGSGAAWLGAELPRGYKNISDQVDVKGLDLLNADTDFGDARGLFTETKPTALDGKSKSKEDGKKDWVESDTDEQLMLYMPFQSTLKVHTLHITSLPPAGDDAEDAPMRPKTIQIYSNRAHVLGFDEAEDIPATHSATLRPEDWDAKTGTAKIELRFVKFQNVTSLVIFVVDGEGDGEKVRVDRLRVVGETGEKREMGKLEKMGHGEE